MRLTFLEFVANFTPGSNPIRGLNLLKGPHFHYLKKGVQPKCPKIGGNWSSWEALKIRPGRKCGGRGDMKLGFLVRNFFNLGPRAKVSPFLESAQDFTNYYGVCFSFE